jgi:hypothetical protein
MGMAVSNICPRVTTLEPVELTIAAGLYIDITFIGL